MSATRTAASLCLVNSVAARAEEATEAAATAEGAAAARAKPAAVAREAGRARETVATAAVVRLRGADATPAAVRAQG